MSQSIAIICLSGVILVAGCARKREPMHVRWSGEKGFHTAVANLPRGAERMAEGKPPLSVLISRPGRLFIINQTTDSLIHTADLTDVGGGGLIAIDPKRKAVVARGASDGDDESFVLAEPIDPEHQFVMYFVSEALRVEQEPATQPQED